MGGCLMTKYTFIIIMIKKVTIQIIDLNSYDNFATFD